MFKNEIDLQMLVDSIVEQKLVTPQQAEEVDVLLQSIRTKGRKYLGEIMIEKGFVSEQVINKFVLAMQGYYEKFCKQMVDKGYLRKIHYEKVIEEKKKSPDRDIGEIVIQSGFMGRDSFYKLFINFAKVPPLGQFLVTKGFITKDQLDEARNEQKLNTFEEILVSKGYLSREQLNKVLDEILEKRARIQRERNAHFLDIDNF